MDENEVIVIFCIPERSFCADLKIPLHLTAGECKQALRRIFRLENGFFYPLSQEGQTLKELGLYHGARIIFANDPETLAGYSSSERAFAAQKAHTSYPLFYRSTRVIPVPDDTPVEILDPPEVIRETAQHILVRLIPSLGMLAASFLMMLRGGAAMMIFSGISAAAALAGMFVSLLSQKRRTRKEKQARKEQYDRYIYEKLSLIRVKREQERQVLNRIYPPLKKQCARLRKFSPALFDLSPSDPDFLCVRLGSGERDARCKVQYQIRERLEPGDELQQIPGQIAAECRTISDVPVIVNLREISALGIAGEDESRFVLLRNLVIDLMARHFPGDVRMVFAAPSEYAGILHWVRLLPHLKLADGRLRGLINDEGSRTALYEYLYKELSSREQEKQPCAHLLVFLWADYGFRSHPLSAFVESAVKCGATFILMGRNKEEILPGCSYLIDVVDPHTAFLINAGNVADSCRFTFPVIPEEEAEELVRTLAPVYAPERSLDNTLIRELSLFAMLKINRAEELDLAKCWQNAKPFVSLAAPVGVNRSGILELDLHEDGHGPHALVAGTTGSGKSELLVTLILSMAVRYHPREVQFLIIDFKGGGMVQPLRALPHLAGAITNIDGRELSRSLRSIRAELLKRQRLFEETGIHHIDRYQKAFREGEVRDSLAHLFIIVDEFAELKSEQPEFMKELISASRIGRSLGIHLILATQKPAGVVSEQIFSNARCRLCLKVQDKADSSEILHSPLAAEIKEPGRGYLQVGNNERFEIFQSALSAAPLPRTDRDRKEFSIFRVADNGRETLLYREEGNEEPEGEALLQSDALVRHICAYCREKQIPAASSIFLPPLKACLEFPEEFSGQAGGLWAVAGLIDDPDLQRRMPYRIDLSSGNLLAIGSSGNGKTTFLMALLRSIAQQYTPEDVQIYILDFASMALKPFERLCHVGGVILHNQGERLRSLLHMLQKETARRKSLFAREKASSLRALRETGKPLPWILLIIDHLTALKELYAQEEEALFSLLREGQYLGICVVAANLQTTGFGYRYLSCFTQRVAFTCQDPGEYSALFDRCRMRPEPVPGRCLIEQEKTVYECQIYLPFPGRTEAEQREQAEQVIQRINEAFYPMTARKVPEIPEHLTDSFLRERFPDCMEDSAKAVLGLAHITAEPLTLDLWSMGSLLVMAQEQNVCREWLQHFMRRLCEKESCALQIYLVDHISRPLEPLKNYRQVAGYTFSGGRAGEFLLQIEGRLRERYAAWEADSAGKPGELILLVIDNPQAVEAISKDPKTLQAYRSITGLYRDLGVFLLLVHTDPQLSFFQAADILRDLRERRHCLYFGELSGQRFLDVPAASIRQFPGTLPPESAYYIKGGDVQRIKVLMENGD